MRHGHTGANAALLANSCQQYQRVDQPTPQPSFLPSSFNTIRRIPNEVCNGNSNCKWILDTSHPSSSSPRDAIHLFSSANDGECSFGRTAIDQPLPELTKQVVKDSFESLMHCMNSEIARHVESKEDQTVMLDEELQQQQQQLLQQNQNLSFSTTSQIMLDEELLQQQQQQQLLQQNQNLSFSTTSQIMLDEELLQQQQQQQQQQLLQKNQNLSFSTTSQIMPDEVLLLQQQQQQQQQQLLQKMPVFSTTPITTAQALLMRLNETSRVSIPFVPTANAQKRALNSPMNIDEIAEKRLRRMLKNRESAARSRARKQAYISHLERQLKGKERQIEELEGKVKALECTNDELRKALDASPKIDGFVRIFDAFVSSMAQFNLQEIEDSVHSGAGVVGGRGGNPVRYSRASLCSLGNELEFELFT
ncbi:putative uncharacterized protein DDB_G0268364 [Ananas comosus]|uniref:BZIP domain-containing protein n=1 Tax=Ananas comosus TaxID=4615 RepID=A0A6P5FWF7_ANACO|nr:putative uncharacterized protein DDB_G0268364 [Ananas comosus]